MIQLALVPGRAIWRWLRTVPLFQSHVGHHVETFIENFLDDQYVRKLRRMRDRPVYTPPQTVTLTRRDLPCYQPDPRFALELHHPGPNELAGNWQPRNILPPRVIAALEHALADETVIDARLAGADVAWSNGPADDPFEGFGDAEGWVKALFAGKVSVPA